VTSNFLTKILTFALIGQAACADAPREPPRAVLRDTAAAIVVASTAPKWSDNSRWRLSEEPILRIELRDDAPEQSPLDPVSAFRTARGEFVVADGNQAGWHRILVYDAGGQFARHLGRKGTGPCEFGQVWQAWPFRGDSVAVFDMARDQVAVLALAGGCGRAVRLPHQESSRARSQRGGFVPFASGVYPDGTMLMAPPGYIPDTASMGLQWYESELHRVDRSGRLVRSLGLFPITQTWLEPGDRGQLRLGRFAVRAIDGFDLLFGDGGAFEILRIDTTGVVRQIMRRPYEPQPVTRRDQEIAVSRRVLAGGERGHASTLNLDQRIAAADWPDTKPAYSDIVIDSNGNVWVEHYRIAAPDLELTDTTPARWSVFNRAGEWLGEVEMPARLFVSSIYADAVLGIWQNEDGARSVRAYTLIKPD
jgi:hypothetical protein